MGGKFFVILVTIGLVSCYESPGPDELSVEGTWITENYDDHLLSSSLRVVMLKFTDDRVEMFFNQPNTAFRFQYQTNRNLMEIGSIALGPDTRLNEFQFIGREGALKLTGLLFGEFGQVFQRSNLNDLEAYKASNLLNEFGPWTGFEGQINFELFPEGQGVFVRSGAQYFISLPESSDLSVIRADRPGREPEFWKYQITRNTMTIGFPDAVGQFTRRFEDNIVSLD